VRLHRHRRIDALHALWMHPQGTTAALAGALLDVPVLLHLNGGDLAAMPAVPFGGRATRPGRLRLRFAAAGASRVTAPSDAAAREAHALGIVAERLTLGVALDRWPVRAPRARANGTPMRLLSVADVRPVKDYTTLLGAVSRLVGSGHDVRLDCVGLGTTHGSIEHGARARGIAHVVHCHEPMPHAALRALVDEAHALVVSSRYEGDPIAALEAAIAGVPVAGTAVGHLTEWAAADAALTCDTGDPAGLATCVARMIEDDALRLRLAANAQALACTHDADAAATRVLALYEALARQPERLWAPAPV
jgi:glycosyltransferase involved in cell wall biosynthesis